MLEVVEVRSKSQLRTFINLPFRLYKKDRFWAPMLKLAQWDLMDPKKNPFFRHAEMQCFLAFRDGRCVGRIAAVVDQNHIKFQEEKCGYFGFFECEDDEEAARKLLDQACEWNRVRGMDFVRGPINPSMNHELGLLVEGFDDIPTLMTTYNFPYYENLIKKSGFEKSKDMYAFQLTDKAGIDERILKHAQRLKTRANITFRRVNMKDYDNEVDRILEIYNDAWEKTWGFVPLEPYEFHHMAKDMKMFLDPRWMMIAEVNGKPAAFSLTFPDVNQVLNKIPSGRLFPFGIFKLLWNLKGPGRKKSIKRIRIMGLGVKKEYVNLGIGPLMYLEHFHQGVRDDIKLGEASWILEDNFPMIKALDRMNAVRNKVYRLYDRTLLSS